MDNQVKITSLELENVKRIKAVKLEPSPNGLTIIGEKNNQGKTSVLDAIAWALGGDKYRPTATAGTTAKAGKSARNSVSRYFLRAAKEKCINCNILYKEEEA